MANVSRKVEIKSELMQPQNTPLTSSASADNVKSSMPSVPEVKEDIFKNWLMKMYNINDIPEKFIQDMYDAFAYQGFNRIDILKQLSILIPDVNISLQVITAGVLRGPQAGSKLKLTNGKTPLEMGIPASGHKGDKVLTMNKIVSATSDIAAWIMKKMNVPKRMITALPGWLQFPSAGSIIMPQNYRDMHIEFSRAFSKQIGGEFNEQIYATMVANAYLDPNLKLFD